MSPYTVAIPDGKNHLLIVVHQPVTREMTLAFAKEAEHLAHTLDNPGILLDVRGAPNVRSTLEDYEVFHSGRRLFKAGARIAVITAEDDRSHDFSYVVANNAGYMYQLFTTEAAAARWIEGPREATMSNCRST